MEKAVINKSTLTTIADAIRTQEGSEDAINLTDFAERILSLNSNLAIDEFSISEISPSTTTQTLEILHSLGKIPSYYIIIPKLSKGTSINIDNGWFMVGNGTNLIAKNRAKVASAGSTSTMSFEVTEESVKITLIGSDTYWCLGANDYQIITIAE